MRKVKYKPKEVDIKRLKEYLNKQETNKKETNGK